MAIHVTAPREDAEQAALFRWAAYNFGRWPELMLMYHIPNEGKRSPVTGAILRANGLKRGVPDVCLPTARGKYHGLYIEMKRVHGSRVSDEQREWIRALRSQGYAAEICHGWEEAAKVIELYMKQERGD